MLRRIASRTLVQRTAPILAVSSPVLCQRMFQGQQQGGGAPGNMEGFRGGMPPQGGAPEGAPAGAPPTEAQAPPTPERPSQPPQMFKTEMNDKGVLTLKLARGPVNSLNLDFFKELNQWLLWYGYDEEVKAIVLTSDLNMVFSAGLDINELYKPEESRFREFWHNFQEIWMILNTFPKPVVAAINGNSPAGGCVLATCCDYRIMARAPAKAPEKLYRIGLNETKLGIVAPPWVMSSYSYILGTRKAERMLQLGETPTADEAMKLGLVDAVVEEADVVTAAVKECEKLLTIPSEARWMSKDMMRRELFQFMSTEQERQYDADFFANMIQNPDVTANIGKYLERLGGGKKKQ